MLPRLYRHSVLMLALAGCSGQLLEPLGPSPDGLGDTESDTDGSDDPQGPGCGAAPLHARFLSEQELRHTLSDLLGLAPSELVELEGLAGPVMDDVRVDELAAERIARAASAMATRAVEQLDSLTLCAWNDASGAAPRGLACTEDQLVESLGTRAYRRSLSADERSALRALYDAGASEDGAREGLLWLLTGLFSAPDFLARFALDDGRSADGDVELTGEELASRLSYFLWHSMPDEALFAAARAGELQDRGKLLAQVQRMLEHPHFGRALHAYYEHWLSLGRFAELARDDPALTPEVIASLERSVLVGIDALYARADPSVTELLSGSTYYLDATLAELYGGSVEGTGFEPVDLSVQKRFGILNHPAFLALHARPAETDPIGRGVFMLRNLFCTELHAPEDVEIPPLPPLAPGLTIRERLEAHTAHAVCRSCHDAIDPLGLSLEAFDELGRHVESKDGAKVDSSGVLSLGTDLDGEFARGEELFSRLGRSAHVRSCFADRFFAYGMARAVARQDRCALERVKQGFVAGGDLKQLVVDIVSSEAFTMRRVEGEM